MTPMQKSHDEWFVWLLSDYLRPHDESGACELVAALYRRRLAGDKPSREEWAEGAWAAWERAAAAALAKAASAAAWAAWEASDWEAAAARVAVTSAATEDTNSARETIARQLLTILRANGIDPAVPGLHARVAVAVGDGSGLDMGTWHTCETTHCRAGWAITVSPLGRELEETFGSALAGAVVYLASTDMLPDFYASDETALADIRQCAGGEAL